MICLRKVHSDVYGVHSTVILPAVSSIGTGAVSCDVRGFNYPSLRHLYNFIVEMPQTDTSQISELSETTEITFHSLVFV